MKLHERVTRCQQASADLHEVALEWIDRHDLTWAEAIRCLAGLITSWSKYPVQGERHPNDPSKRADEA